MEVGITVHNHGGVAAQFENNFLLPGAALDVPSDGNTSRKTDELDAIVGDQQTGIFVRQRQDVESTIGPASLLHTFSKHQ